MGPHSQYYLLIMHKLVTITFLHIRSPPVTQLHWQGDLYTEDTLAGWNDPIGATFFADVQLKCVPDYHLKERDMGPKGDHGKHQ